MLEMSDTGLRLPVLKNNTAFKIGRYHHPTYDSDVVYIGDDYDSNVDSPARIEFNRNSINLTARLLNMNLTDSRFYVNGHPMGKASDIKQSQRWSNINMQAWNFGNLGIINILHPSGTNAHIMGNDNPTEIGRISPLNAPRITWAVRWPPTAIRPCSPRSRRPDWSNASPRSAASTTGTISRERSCSH